MQAKRNTDNGVDSVRVRETCSSRKELENMLTNIQEIHQRQFIQSSLERQCLNRREHD